MLLPAGRETLTFQSLIQKRPTGLPTESHRYFSKESPSFQMSLASVYLKNPHQRHWCSVHFKHTRKTNTRQTYKHTCNQRPPKNVLSYSTVHMECRLWLEPTLSGWRLTFLGVFPCCSCKSGVQYGQGEEGELIIQDKAMYGSLQTHCDIWKPAVIFKVYGPSHSNIKPQNETFFWGPANGGT